MDLTSDPGRYLQNPLPDPVDPISGEPSLAVNTRSLDRPQTSGRQLGANSSTRSNTPKGCVRGLMSLMTVRRATPTVVHLWHTM